MSRGDKQRTKEQEVLKTICSLIKVNPALMNERDHVLLDFHYKRIRLEKANSLENQVGLYKAKNEVSLYRDFYDVRKIEELKKTQDDLAKRVQKVGLDIYLSDLLEFNFHHFDKHSDVERKKWIKEASLNVYCVNQIIDDYEYNFDLFVNRKDLKGLYPTISTKLDETHYLLDKPYYQCVIQVEDDKLIATNFVINERNKNRIKELQR